MKKTIKTEKLIRMLEFDLNNCEVSIKQNAYKKEFNQVQWYSSRKQYILMLLDDIQKDNVSQF